MPGLPGSTHGGGKDVVVNAPNLNPAHHWHACQKVCAMSPKYVRLREAAILSSNIQNT